MEVIFNIIQLIIENWGKSSMEIGPYEFLLDELGELTKDKVLCGQILVSLRRSDYSEAIKLGFDDLSGITFYYLAKHLREDTHLVPDMHVLKHGLLPHQNIDS